MSNTCVKLPKIPDIPDLKLLGGAELKAFLDFSQGMPTDCKLTFNLILQLSPLLASMACLLKILNVIGKLQDFVGAAKPPFTKLPDTIPGLLDAIDQLKDCIPLFAIPQLIIMIKGMLSLVINFLLCFISQLEDILEFRASIDFGSAEGNPILLEALRCADDNAQVSMDNLMLSLQPMEPLLKMVAQVADITQLPELKLPDLSSISASADAAASISSIRQAVESIQSVIDGLPG